ncbi:hypothetical protein VTP01DRAFT_10095 [Rhizomucor pusillus]|uniref:uncharacterized protein n=1 Tax=Rhizomucor pusillus TaxID=4840 RepID=UPI0037420C00
MRKWRIKHYFLIAIFFIASYFASAQTNATLNSTLPTYKIGVLFPDPVSVRASDPTLNDMIVASEVAISMAAANISRNNIIPDVQLNFIRFYSNDSNVGQTAWTTVNMVEAGINAVIGDMVSSVTEAEAGITGVRHIPQCSCASASVDLSDKSAYPYFFRTVGDVVLYGRSLVDWVQHMGWNMFALIYTNDNVGQQAVLSAMVSRAQEYGIQAMTQIPLYDLNNVEASLERLVNSGARIVIFADSDTSDQLTVLKAAMSMGLLSEGWVWMLTNDMSPAIRDMVETQEELDAYDGLMFISGIWNLTGIPAYDSMVNEWRQQPVPGNFTTPSAWNTMGLSYNAPNAYACAELLALGLNKALNEYSGGRHAGLSDLAAGKFDSTNMIPAFYNLNYTGPAGAMEFFDTGNLKTGYFSLQYMLEGSVVTYATLMDGNFSFVNDTPIIYLGHSLKKPVDMVAKYALNPTLSSPAGITVATISAIGLVACLLMLILIISFRGLKAIMIASPFFCCVQLVGLMLTYISTLLYLDKPNIAKCIARQFTMTCGFVFVIGGIIAKSYRIYRIFQNVFTVRTSRLKSAYLIRIIVVFGVIALLPLIVWHIVYPVEVYDIMISAETYCWLCVYPHAPADWLHLNVAQLVVLIWGAVLVVLAALLAFKTRKVRGKWAETNQIAYVS